MNDKTIIRRERGKQNPYFIMARDIPQNKELSYEAVGMAAYFLSKPDDWQIIIADLIRDGAGRDKVYRILRELRTAGYLHQEKYRNERGRFVHGDYIFTESPHPEKPYLVKPDQEKPDQAKPTLQNRDSTKQQTPQKREENKGRKAEPKPYEVVPKHERLLIIEAWSGSLSISPVNPAGQDKNHAAAADIYLDGYRAGQVRAFVKAQMNEAFWIGKTLTLAKVGELMPSWLLRQPDAAPQTSPTDDQPSKFYRGGGVEDES